MIIKRPKSPIFASILILVGLLIFLNPFGTLEFLVGIVAVVILLWGINSISTYSMHSAGKPYLLTQGILNVIFAIILLAGLNLAVKTIMLLFGLYVMVMSTFKIIQGLRLKKYNIVGWKNNVIGGFIVFVVGMYIAFFPALFPMILGAILIGTGISMVVRK